MGTVNLVHVVIKSVFVFKSSCTGVAMPGQDRSVLGIYMIFKVSEVLEGYFT